jgi:tight adherence protein B
VNPTVLAPVLLGVALGAGVLLMAVGIRGTVTDPARPPSRAARALQSLRRPAMARQAVAGVVVGLLVLIVTGWPVAAVGLGALTLLWPRLFGGSSAEARRIAELEALVVWIESLKDTIAGHASLEHAIPASAAAAPDLVRPALLRLVGRIRARVPLEDGLRALAADLDDPSADLVIAALILNVRRRGDGLRDVLGGLATSAREELEMRRRVSAERVQLRRGVQIIVGVTIGVAAFLTIFNPEYLKPYDSAVGQVVLAVVMGIFASSLVRMRRLSVQEPVPAFLARPGRAPDALESRLVAILVDNTSATRVVAR